MCSRSRKGRSTTTGSLIHAVYSASSAGYTASSKNVWGTDYPYLQSRFCDLDKQYDPNYGRKVEYTSAEIKSKVLEKTGIDLTGDPSGWLSVETNVDGFYVGQMNVGGYHSYTDSSGDSVKITGRVFRERIMSFELRSSAFDVEYDANSDKFIFTTYGYGHGVGEPDGANALATYGLRLQRDPDILLPGYRSKIKKWAPAHFFKFGIHNSP